MSFLHDIYYRFKDKGLEIIGLSLDLDKDYNEVEEYRKNNWPMPWLFCKKYSMIETKQGVKEEYS